MTKQRAIHPERGEGSEKGRGGYDKGAQIALFFQINKKLALMNKKFFLYYNKIKNFFLSFFFLINVRLNTIKFSRLVHEIWLP